MPSFDYEGARKAGYSDDEIAAYLTEKNPSFNVDEARKAGYSLEEIDKHLSSNEVPKASKEVKIENPSEKSILEKGARIAGQYALGAAENALLPYEFSVAPLASKEAQNASYRELLGDELDQLMEKKAFGQWTDEDQKLYEHIVEQIKDPRKSMEYAQTADVGLRSLIEKGTGLDLKPEGIAEKAAHWSGFIKDPKKIFELGKTGLKTADVIKAISPSGSEVMRGLGAGVALELAERGDFGPIGTMAAAVVGDISGGIAASGAKVIKNIVTKPKETLAEVASKFTKKDKLDLQKELIKDFRESNLQADIGTLTDSDLVKWTQSRLAQSGLTGKGLDELKEQLTTQIKEEYKALSESLGESIYQTNQEAGEVAKEGIKTIRDKDLDNARELYKKALNEVGESSFVDSKKVADEIENIEKNLKPGNLKSSEQNSVLEIIERVKRDIYDSEGNLIYGKVKDLINDKIALNDIINYEVQGGSKQLLKGLVKELDRAIISYGKENARFAKNYIKANKNFSQHAKTFRNKNIAQLLNSHDPAQLMNKMNSVQGIRDLGQVLQKTPEGESIFNGLKRMRLDQLIGNNMVDSTTQQIKFGTFSKLLEKGKNRDIIKEILSPQSFRRLQKLQKNAGKLAETAQKFLNTSKSGVILEDAGIVTKALIDLGHILNGNPWPLVRTGVGVSGARYLTKLISDPQFLQLVEEMILASEQNNIPLMIKIAESLVNPIKAALNETNQD
jgi:hypothetical protein